jgi:mannose-6-phosphate isomerase-like protein (cupin superfamily)
MTDTLAVRPVGTAQLRLIAEGLARTAGDWPGLREPVERTWRTVAATDRYEAFVIAWPVGGTIELHDHGDSAGAVVVVGGTLVETSVAHDVDGCLVTSSRALGPDDHLEFGPGHVHDLANLGTGPALSVHVYSPVLRSMTFFEPRDGSVLVAVRTEDYRVPGSHR